MMLVLVLKPTEVLRLDFWRKPTEVLRLARTVRRRCEQAEAGVLRQRQCKPF
jgi:hypothetical protein